MCRQLAHHGQIVILGSRDDTRGREAAREISGDGLTIFPCQLDVTDLDSIERVRSRVAADYGRLDVLVAALNALTRILAAELRRDRILVNAVCPGWVATDMGGPGGRPVEKGAASIVWAAVLPDDGPTGGSFRDGRPVPW